MMIICVIPVIANIVLNIPSYWAGGASFSDDLGPGTFYPLFMVMSALPALFVIADLLIEMFRSKGYIQRKKYQGVLFFTSVMITGYILQIIRPDTPSVCVCVLLGVIAYHVRAQNYSIMISSKGHINSRYAFERYLGNRFEDRRAGKIQNLYVAFGDMDRFGVIKHEYGKDVMHNILYEVNSLLMDLSERDFFPCCISGDEFAFVLTSESSEVAEKHINDVYSAISDHFKDRPYSVHMSIGMVEYSGQDSVEQMLTEADEVSSRAKEKYYVDNGFTRGKK